MLRTRENSEVFNSRDKIYLIFTSKKQISSMYHDKSILSTLFFSFTFVNIHGTNRSWLFSANMLISAFVFTNRYCLIPKFPASSHFRYLYSSVCVRPVQKPHCCFFHDTAPFFISGILYIQRSWNPYNDIPDRERGLL